MGSMLKDEPACGFSTSQKDDTTFRSFEITGLQSDQNTSLTGMKDELLLLSWLIVLLRTQEGSQICYEWAYGGPVGKPGHELLNSRMSMEEVIPNLQSNVRDVAAAICRKVTFLTPNVDATEPGPVSLFLSTISLSGMPEETKDEGVLHLEIFFSAGYLRIRPAWRTKNMMEYTVTRYIETLVDTVKMSISSASASIEECLRPTAHDLDAIWGWNHTLPPSYNFCMHEMVCQQAQRFPDKVAISSWDGDLTYTQIDHYSTLVASSLQEMSVELNDVLPVCFEKSRWTIVAVLAVMKAGATFVLMDPTLPLARLQNMAQQQHDLSSSIMPSERLFVVESDTFTHISSSKAVQKLPVVPSSTLMYLIFTSGSTGTPKGVKISHETYTSSAIPRAKAVGYTENSVVLDFASYAFDVSIDSMFLTLGNGGRLCIPSDEDRLNDINGVIRRMQVNYAGLTPSVARILDADVITSLSALGLGGEAVSARDVTLWGQDTRIVIGYGPCECTIGCTINSSAATGRDYISIGQGNGAAIWIVNQNDHEQLMPVGAVGEILVEGPIVGQGYLNDPDKTMASFIHDPAWLVAGYKDYTGRKGRLYKTGDLGRYDPDGSGGIVFVGRKDTQVKLRGQRVELGEIESQLRARLPSDFNVIAEVIVSSGSGGQPTLVAFIASQSIKGSADTDISLMQLHGELRETLSKADADVAKVLPRYMVPTAYIPVNYIPVLISGKTDRKRLRQFGTTVDLRQLDDETTNTGTRGLSDLEQRLQQAWGQALKLDPEVIRPNDNFFALGGNSLTAMALVSFCRAKGLDLTVANTFEYPTLSTMASSVRICVSRELVEIPPFSMVTKSVERARLDAAQACQSDKSCVEDIYPCTPTQESLFTFSIKSTQVYVAQRVACIPSNISLDAWKEAWAQVVAAIPILRTHLTQLQEEPGLQQVILKETISWRHSTDLSQYLENDRNEKMELGQNLARYAIVDSEDGNHYMVWTVHHVLYDGWSEPLILKMVGNALQHQSIEIQTQIRDFVKYVHDIDEVAMHEFWRRELQDAVGPQFPHLPSRDFLPTPDAMLERQIYLETGTGLPFTMATLIRGAWALVASQYTGSNDVVFGETLTGRDIPLIGVESVVGPLIATVPVRIRINRMSTVETYLQTVQNGMLARTPYQHMGMQNIRKVSPDAQHACEAGTGLVIQPEPDYVGSELGFGKGDVVLEALHFNPYPLMLGCGIQKGGFRVCASFDSSLISVSQMKRILSQLEMACLQLMKGLSKRIREISCLPGSELNQIWLRNQVPPLSLNGPSGRLQADTNIKQGSIYPPVVVQWVCNPQNPSLLSPIGCIGELWLEGALVSGEAIESPDWLLAGSSDFVGREGRVQRTGDMVQLQEDGSLIFVGRKQDFLQTQGRVVDIENLEALFTRYIPKTTPVAAAVFSSSSESGKETLEREIIAFIELTPSSEETVEVMPETQELSYETLHPQILKTTICARIPISLTVQTKKLNKFVRDSLPSFMVPSTYVVVDKIPTVAGQINRDLLNELASRIPQHVFRQLREGFKGLWTRNLIESRLTIEENILRDSWAKVLGISPEQIEVDDNFFRLGGDSVLAMKLVSNLRAQGHSLTVADIFQKMRLGDTAKVLKVNQASEENTQVSQTYKPFSILSHLNIEPSLADTVKPMLVNPDWSIKDAYPATDSQALDIRATIQAPRTSIQYTMLYFDEPIDHDQIIRACNKLIKSHDILRTVFVEHESRLFQIVLDEIDVPVTLQQVDGNLDEHVTEICKMDIESDYHLGSSFLRIFYSQNQNGQSCLIIGLSHALYDGLSLPVLLQDLETLYTGGHVVSSQPFSSYIARIFDERIRAKAVRYWQGLLRESSLSVIGGKSAQPADKAIFQTRPVEISQRPKEITTANLVTAAWALVLARHLQILDVTFGSVTSGRNLDSVNAAAVMGPCYQFTPVRISFEFQWTTMDLLQFVQKQSAESAAHDFLGFEKISKQCTQWSSEMQFFDSIVHHQDWEDFDTMPFAGGSCRVDILNPHGDAISPLKIVSFVRGGETNVGIVGSERDVVLVDALLDELATAVQELATCHSDHILVDRQRA
ncbi:nonribosomal siderophore peptide synthase Sid2 [Xylogone sp. PMI_703]|nr:nonribosomal siderophore peptide synthase Sid2 [Xylogone sp. PMI_703]